MVTLYVVSSAAGAGKTTVSAGLAKDLLDRGKKVGYLKPATAASTDASFMKAFLHLEEPLNEISPQLTGGDLISQYQDAYAKVSGGKDVIIIEDEKPVDGETHKIADALDARVIIVEAYSQSPSTVNYKDLGNRLLGVVVNKVPKSQLKSVPAQYSSKGVRVLGLLPEDRALLSLTVGELAEYLQGKIVDGEKPLSELVEDVMLGAMYVDSGLEYFGRKRNKAVVLRGERPDMQLAALDTSTRCLVLTGASAPTSLVLHRAREKKVPVILTSADVATAVTSIEDALGKARFNEKKLPRLLEMMSSFDFPAVWQGLGLAG